MNMHNSEHNGNGHDPDEDRADNIVNIPTLAERDRMRREKEKEEARLARAAGKGEPLINLPPMTKLMLAVLIGIHLVLTFAVSDPQKYEIFETFGFKPAYYTVDFPGWPAFLGPFTYMLIHGSTIHIVMNSVMLMAFGTGVERWMGGRRMLVFFVLCSLAAALFQFIITPTSVHSMIGASGGVSGLFAAAIIMLYNNGQMGTGRYGLWPLIGIWVAISIIFGLLGGPDGSAIAWAAHIGGFLAGFLFLKPVMRMKI